MQDRTIAAISTAQGQGGIGVIRISGKSAIAVADRVFETASGKKLCDLKGYSAAYGRVVENSEVIDDAIATVFRKPHSYTGEDTVEISCHGGIYVTRAVLRAVLKNGASPAQPGEFTKLAFLNGKMDLINAEAVMDIIGAKGRASARAANAAKDGSLHKKINSVKDKLTDCAAHLAAWADYPDDDIETVDVKELSGEINDCIGMLRTLIKDSDKGRLMSEGIDTAIVGKPNVGKSTLMNLLSGSDRSIVTDIPGTTRDIVEETVALGDFILKISDTAGIRQTDDLIEKIGVDLAKKRLSSCELVIAVFDNSQALNDDDIYLIEKISDMPCVAVVNKNDLPCKADIDFIKSKIKHTVCISAKQSDGIDQLTSAIADIFDTEGFDPSSGVLSSERQISAADNALSSLVDAKDALENGLTLDAVNAAVDFSLQSLMELTGENANVEVVNRVFSKFCVGK